MIKAVLFDMDGVIFDSERCVIEIWKETAREYHIDNIEYACRKCLGINAVATEKIFKEIYGQDFDYKYYKGKMREHFMEKYGEGRLPLKPNVEDFFIYLKEKGIKIGLGTSTRQVSAEAELKWAGLHKYFDALVYGDMITNSKPNPDIFLKGMELLGVEPNEVIVVEDSYNGIRAASRAGAYPVMVPDLIAPDEEMESLAYRIVPKINDIRDIIENLNSLQK